jgi:hypothetical protein
VGDSYGFTTVIASFLHTQRVLANTLTETRVQPAEPGDLGGYRAANLSIAHPFGHVQQRAWPTERRPLLPLRTTSQRGRPTGARLLREKRIPGSWVALLDRPAVRHTRLGKPAAAPTNPSAMRY